MHSEREVMSPQPTKTVSVQIKLDLRRPGTFNYPKYHQRRCHDLTSARINGVLTKSLTLRANWASRLSVWTGAAGSFLHHRLGLSNCTCHGYDDSAFKNRMTKTIGEIVSCVSSFVHESAVALNEGIQHLLHHDKMHFPHLFHTYYPKPIHTIQA